VAPDPPKIAEALPAPFIAKLVPVNTPVVPVIEPLVNVTAPTESLNVDIPRVPPATVTAAESAKRFADPKLSDPLFTLTVVAPKVPFKEVVPVATVAVPAPKFALTVPPFNP
jgi:hypothetical protein